MIRVWDLKRPVAFIACVGMVWLGGQLAVSALLPTDPLIEAGCESCHLAGDQVDPSNANLLVSSEEQLCGGCHPGAIEASHPSGVIPSMTVPAAFPLDWKGDLTCSSCHFVHDGGHGRLRVEERGEAFCTYCHELAFFEQMIDGGSSLLLSGHLSAGSNLEEIGIDAYSIQCMTCHENEAEGGSGDPVVIDSQGVARHTGGSINHPIAVVYTQAVSFGGYRDPQLLDASISLPDGLVSCISCHRGYSQDHGSVVTVMQGSKLCFQCHDI